MIVHVEGAYGLPVGASDDDVRAAFSDVGDGFLGGPLMHLIRKKQDYLFLIIYAQSETSEK